MCFFLLFRLIPYEFDSYIKVIVGAVIACAIIIPVQFGIVLLTERDVLGHVLKLLRKSKREKQ